nr:MAG TPA: Integrase [Caudoviricetes sp.]
MKTHHSQIKVYPVSWDKNIKSNLKTTWEIQYKFYCTDYPQGYTVRLKGMNRAKTLEEKQFLTKQIINIELDNLKKGFNPITREFEIQSEFVVENTPFIQALNIAFEKTKLVKSTIKSIKDTIKLVSDAALNIGISTKPISEIKKKDIRIILDYLLTKGYSNDRYNKVKTYLGILFNYFVDLDIFEHNFLHFIKKRPHTPKIRTIFRKDDKEKFMDLKTINYKLWRILTMYYCSQTRITEFRNIKLSDVHFDKQYFIIFERKGKRYHEVIKPINIHVAKLWKEVLSEAEKDDLYLFCNDLIPGTNPCTEWSLSNKYRRWVKGKLGIEADMGSLRHTFANDITTNYGLEEAQKALGHTNQKTTRIYAVDYKEQLLEKQKQLKIGM